MTDNNSDGTSVEDGYQHAAGHAFQAVDLVAAAQAHLAAGERDEALMDLASAVGNLAESLAQMYVTEAGIGAAHADARRALDPLGR